MASLYETTGKFGEYNIASTNTTDNVVDKIKDYELTFSDNEYLLNLKEKFKIKNIGIKNMSNSDIIVKINERPVMITANSSFNLPYVEFIESVVFSTVGANVSIRYVY